MFFFLFLLFENTFANELRIYNANDLIDFSNKVNNKVNYKCTTVYLDNDIVFNEEQSQQFEPIGKSESYYFLGTFDGQGHTISNLIINLPNFRFVGLFGFSTGTTIKNVVLDGSCSFECSFNSSHMSNKTGSYIAGIIGKINSNKGLCTIENCVNMANLTFNGNNNWDPWMGGIGGFLVSSIYKITITNCINYGTIINSGITTAGAFIGGIIAELRGNITSNCLNYGSLIHNGTSINHFIGGITGKSWNAVIENCVNAGKIILNSYR